MIEKSPNQLAITIDIEDWYHIPSVCGSPFSVYKNVEEFFQNWDKRYDYLSEPTHRVLNILETNKIKATFFVVADIAQYYPGLIESIVESGHEIACHGLHHECVIDPKTKKPLMDQETFKKKTKKAKNILEKISGERVIGYRAPSAYIAGWMIESLNNLGFSYDSSVSVNSIYNKTDSSLNNVSSYPYHPGKGNLEPGDLDDFIEFPLAYWEFFNLKVPTSGGPMLRFLGSNIVSKGLEQSLKRGHSVFYFHPLDLSYETFPNVGRGRPFYWIIKGGIVEKRIMKILNCFKNIHKNPLKDIIR